MSEDEIFELAIDSGANDCIMKDIFYEIQCKKNEIYNIKKKIETKIKNFISTEIEWKSLNDVKISKDKEEVMAEFLEALENDDDVQRVFTNLKFGNN